MPTIPEIPLQDESTIEEDEQGDLFKEPSRRKDDASAEEVFVDLDGKPESGLEYVGAIQLPRPLPTELYVRIQDFYYVFKLDRRDRAIDDE